MVNTFGFLHAKFGSTMDECGFTEALVVGSTMDECGFTEALVVGSTMDECGFTEALVVNGLLVCSAYTPHKSRWQGNLASCISRIVLVWSTHILDAYFYILTAWFHTCCCQGEATRPQHSSCP